MTFFFVHMYFIGKYCVCIAGMTNEFESYEKQLQQLTSRIDELNKNMTAYLAAIQQKASEYRSCTT